MSQEVSVKEDSKHDKKNESWSGGHIKLDDGARLYCWQNGIGNEKTILFLNGALGSGETDSRIFLDNMSRDFNCVSIDMRGFGLSKDEERAFSVDDYYQDASDCAEVMRILGYEKYSVFGMSDGGQIGVILAARYSDCVEFLIIYGAQCYLTENDKMMYDALLDLNNWHPTLLDSRVKYYGREGLLELLKKLQEVDVALIEKRGGDICLEELKNVKCSTLIIHGDEDIMHSMEHAQFLKDVIQNSTLRIWEGRHILMMSTHPYELINMITDFINNK